MCMQAKRHAPALHKLGTDRCSGQQLLHVHIEPPQIRILLHNTICAFSVAVRENFCCRHIAQPNRIFGEYLPRFLAEFCTVSTIHRHHEMLKATTGASAAKVFLVCLRLASSGGLQRKSANP